MNKVFDIISLDGYLYMIDKEISKYSGKRKTVFCLANPNDFGGLRMNCETGFCELCRDVLASTNPSLDLPKLPEVKKQLPIQTKALKRLSEISKKYDEIKRPDLKYDGYEEQVFLDGFIDGYQANPNKYSEEDMKKAFIEGTSQMYDYMKGSELGYAADKSADSYIKSLNQPKVPVQVEVEMRTEGKFDSFYDMKNGIPELIDNQVIVKRWVYEQTR